jgi:hypothetical protein
MCASDGRYSIHEFPKEFGGIVRVQNIRRAATKMELVEKSRYEGGSLAVGKGDEQNSLGEAVYQGEGFRFTRGGKALSLKVHSIAGAGLVGCVRGEEAMS